MVAGFTSRQHLEDASKCFCIVSFPCDRRCPLAIRRDEELLQADLYFRLICHTLTEIKCEKINGREVKMGAFMMCFIDSVTLIPFEGKRKHWDMYI